MPSADKKPKTLYDKVLDHHIVNEQEDGTLLIYIGKTLSLRDAISDLKGLISRCRQTFGSRSDFTG